MWYIRGKILPLDLENDNKDDKFEQLRWTGTKENEPEWSQVLAAKRIKGPCSLSVQATNP